MRLSHTWSLLGNRSVFLGVKSRPRYGFVVHWHTSADLDRNIGINENTISHPQIIQKPALRQKYLGIAGDRGCANGGLIVGVLLASDRGRANQRLIGGVLFGSSKGRTNGGLVGRALLPGDFGRRAKQ